MGYVMPVFEVIEAKRQHCRQMARKLRREQADAVVRFGADAHRELVGAFDRSSWRKAWMIDGHLAGLGGVQSSLAASEGIIWLAVTQNACRFPVSMVRTARQQIAEIMQTRRKIVTTIFQSDSASKRFAIHLGFEICGDAIEQNGQRLIPVSLER